MKKQRTKTGQQLRTITINNKNYLYVQDIKINRPDLKVDVDKIIYIDEEPLINEEDVAQKTQFDEMISKTLNKKK